MTEITQKQTRTDERAPKLSKTEARQAVTPHRLRFMLAFGIIGVVIAFAILYFLFLVM
jgi:hypothetical protein